MTAARLRPPATGREIGDVEVVEASLRRRLRAGTAAIHDRLDDSLADIDLGDDRRLAAYLLAQARAHQQVETLLRSAPRRWVDHGWSRLPALAADLDELGSGLAVSASVPPSGVGPWSAARWAGLFYVVEGSMLGQRHLLAQRAGRSRPIAADRFLSSAGIDVSERWTEARAVIERLGAGDPAAAIEGAVVGFGIFERRLAEVSVELRSPLDRRS